MSSRLEPLGDLKISSREVGAGGWTCCCPACMLAFFEASGDMERE